MVGGGNCCLCILYGFDAGSGVLEMDIEDKENEAVFEKAAFEKAVGEGLINGVYIDIDARLTAEKHKLSWQMVEYWAGREYESQQIKGCNSWN